MRPRAEIQKGTSRIPFMTAPEQHQRTLEAILEVLLDLRALHPDFTKHLSGAAEKRKSA